jgi:hypothetical protein
MAVPAGLERALDSQSDLVRVTTAASVIVYRNLAFHGVVATRPTPLTADATSSSVDSVTGWSPALAFEQRLGTIAAGATLAGVAPANAWTLVVNGHDVPRHTVLGWAAQYTSTGGAARLVLHQFPLNGLLALFTLGLWLISLISFGGSERLAALLLRRRPRRRARHGGGDA